MKVLVVGGGGREHALVWKIAQSRGCQRFSAPLEMPGSRSRPPWCRSKQVTGRPSRICNEGEDRPDRGGSGRPLTRGCRPFRDNGTHYLRPSRKAAEIEGSKAYAKEIMRKYGIPTASSGIFEDRDEAVAYIRKTGAPIVVKADGLAAGKGSSSARRQKKRSEPSTRSWWKRPLAMQGGRW